jgi:hypothetical protein
MKPSLSRTAARVQARRESHHSGDDGGDYQWYGAFKGGDARTFQPDPECITADEWRAWRIACEAAERGTAEPLRPAHSLDHRGHIARVMFGYGNNHHRPGPWRTWDLSVVAANPEFT